MSNVAVRYGDTEEITTVDRTYRCSKADLLLSRRNNDPIMVDIGDGQIYVPFDAVAPLIEGLLWITPPGWTPKR